MFDLAVTGRDEIKYSINIHITVFSGMMFSLNPITTIVFYQAVIAIKISNLLICFCSFDLSCPIIEKYIFIPKKLFIVLSCLIK